MAYTNQIRTGIQQHIQEHGLGNVIFHEVWGNDGPQSFALRCSVCSYQVMWAFNPLEEFGIELELLTSFCLNHRHGKEPLPKLSMPALDPEATQVLTKAAIQHAVAEVKAKNMLMHPQIVKDIEEEGDPFNLLGDIQHHVSKSATVTAISASSIKWVARKSNFNVDLQCRPGRRGPEYRAVCDNCKEAIALTHEIVLATDKGVFSGELEQFLSEHKHDGTGRDVFGGRKFRNVS